MQSDESDFYDTLPVQDDFAEALGKFAIAYADQAERDHASLRAAARAGIIAVQMDR